VGTGDTGINWRFSGVDLRIIIATQVRVPQPWRGTLTSSESGLAAWDLDLGSRRRL